MTRAFRSLARQGTEERAPNIAEQWLIAAWKHLACAMNNRTNTVAHVCTNTVEHVCCIHTVEHGATCLYSRRLSTVRSINLSLLSLRD